jgi:hypothetical protein
MTDTILDRLTTDPATAYRELLYRPTGDLASMVDREFAVVARPGRVPDSDLRRGDVLLEVELGHPGRGRCATLGESAVETVTHGRRLPRGRVVLRSRVVTDLRRPQPVEPELPDEPEPLTVDPMDAEFVGTEHKSIGDDGSGRTMTTIQYGDPPRPLSFGDVVSLAGDYFGTFEELRRLGDTPAGRQELAWTLWDCLGNRGPEPPAALWPPAAQTVKDRVTDRYYDLAANNISHFSWGGAAWPTYTQWHGQALVDAFEAGQLGDDARWQRALAKEAFGDHFLTDSFSGGHVRTPRLEIQNHYLATTAGSAPFVSYLADFMTDRLHMTLRGRIVRATLHGIVEGQIASRVRRMGGHALASFTLGDIVSLALHDHDNNGLSAISDLDESGRPTRGVPWTAVGDGHIEARSGHAPTADALKTAAMAAAAVRASLTELQRVRDAAPRAAGASTSRPDQIRAALGSPRFAAQSYLPRANPDPRANPPLTSTDGSRAPLEWHWGHLGDLAYAAVDLAVRTKIADAIARLARDQADAVDSPVGEISGIKDALRAFAVHLRTSGIAAIEQAVGRRAR